MFHPLTCGLLFHYHSALSAPLRWSVCFGRDGPIRTLSRHCGVFPCLARGWPSAWALIGIVAAVVGAGILFQWVRAQWPRLKAPVWSESFPRSVAINAAALGLFLLVSVPQVVGLFGQLPQEFAATVSQDLPTLADAAGHARLLRGDRRDAHPGRPLSRPAQGRSGRPASGSMPGQRGQPTTLCWDMN